MKEEGNQKKKSQCIHAEWCGRKKEKKQKNIWDGPMNVERAQLGTLILGGSNAYNHFYAQEVPLKI